MKKRIKFKPRFYYMLCGLVLLIGLGIFFAFNSSKPVNIKNGEIAFSHNYDSVIVREEKVYKVDDFGKVTMVASEGQKVEKDGKIAEVYKWDYSQKVSDELIDVQQRIKQYQENNFLKNLANKDLEKIDTDINAKIAIIKNIGEGKEKGDLLQIEQDLKQLLDDRKKLVQAIITKPDQQLQELYDQEAQIAKKISDWKTDILAETSGVVSYYFDNSEDYFTVANIDNFTKQDFDNIVSGKIQKNTENTDGKKSLYRLVDNLKWYAVITGPKEGIKELVLDNTYGFKFEGVYDKTYTGKLVGERALDGAVLYKFEFNDDVSSLLSLRSTNAQISKTYSGYKIKDSAIKTVDGITGVYVDVDGKKTFVEVKKIISQDDYTIIEFLASVPAQIMIYE